MQRTRYAHRCGIITGQALRLVTHPRTAQHRGQRIVARIGSRPRYREQKKPDK
jgi:hypothetical protein